MPNVLIKLHPGYGLGDAVQMSAVMRHVAAARPDWVIDYQAEPGRDCVMHGLVNRYFTYQESLTTNYDLDVTIHLYDTFAAWPDRPNTRVVSCLQEKFGLSWKPELARYVVNLRQDVIDKVSLFMDTLPNGGIVAVHYQGDSLKEKKDLSHWQARKICDAILNLGCVPLLLDWRGVFKVSDDKDVCTVSNIKHRDEWGRDAQVNCAIISQCDAYIGIDSGPSKCASATGTPSLVCWTKNHPSLFHDPAQNTTHLVPHNYRTATLLRNSDAVCDFFEANYNWESYVPDKLTASVFQWLRKVLDD